MNVRSMEDFRFQMRSVMVRNDVEAWNLAVKIKNEFKLKSVFEVLDLPDEALAPIVSRLILESSLDE